MKIDILTIFPEMFNGFINTSIIKKAILKKLVEVNIVDIRSFSKDKTHRVDDTPCGGGAGLIMRLQPICDALESVRTADAKVYLLSAKGPLYKQSFAKELAQDKHIILICGHYEGVDERILDYIDGEICIGDYILTGGELPAMIVADSIIRLLDGVISKDSLNDESFENNLLEYPQYTNPRDFDGKKVPDILFSGNHQAIKEWRFKESINKTLKNRPELFDESKLNKQERKLYENIQNDKKQKEAIEKARKFMK